MLIWCSPRYQRYSISFCEKINRVFNERIIELGDRFFPTCTYIFRSILPVINKISCFEFPLPSVESKLKSPFSGLENRKQEINISKKKKKNIHQKSEHIISTSEKLIW